MVVGAVPPLHGEATPGAAWPTSNPAQGVDTLDRVRCNSGGTGGAGS
jgi:hypothetical protein